MVEQAHFGTTRYTTLSLSVIQVPGNPMLLPPKFVPHLSRAAYSAKKANKPGLFNACSPVST